MGDITATNPRTGERLVLRNGQWQPLGAPAAGGGTVAERGAQVTGMPGQRAQAMQGARVQSRQEQTQEREIGMSADQLQLLGGLGRARRLIEGNTPTGPQLEHGFAFGLGPGTMEMARRYPYLQGALNIPNREQLTNEGELEKLSTLAATAVAGQTTTGMDANTRAAIRGALFGTDRSQGENRRNVNYLLQQYVNQGVSQRVQQAWRSRYGDVNAVDPATGMTASDYFNALRRQLPNYGDSFEDRNAYRTRVQLRNGSSLDLPELSPFIDSVVSAIRGEVDRPEVEHEARPGARAAPQQQQTRVRRYNPQTGRIE